MQDEKYTLLGYLNYEGLKQDNEHGQLIATEGLSRVFNGLFFDMLALGTHLPEVVEVAFSPDGPYLDWKYKTYDEWIEFLTHIANHIELAEAIAKMEKKAKPNE